MTIQLPPRLPVDSLRWSSPHPTDESQQCRSLRRSAEKLTLPADLPVNVYRCFDPFAAPGAAARSAYRGHRAATRRTTGLLPSRPGSPTGSSMWDRRTRSAVTRRPGWPWPHETGGGRLLDLLQSGLDQANLDWPARYGGVHAVDRAGTPAGRSSHHGCSTWRWPAHPGYGGAFAPSSAAEVEVMLTEALRLDGPSVSASRRPRPPGSPRGRWGRGCTPGRTRTGDGSVCILAVGKMLTAAESAADELGGRGSG